MNIAFFGSSLVSAYWNGAATYYRGIIRALSERGHHITFYEPDAHQRQSHRDIQDPIWARVVVYDVNGPDGMHRALEDAANADLIVKASGVGIFDCELEHAVLNLKSPPRAVAFWDVDAPATLDRVENDPGDPFRKLIPDYDIVFTYGGGAPVVSRYSALGARDCVPVYNALDPTTHHRGKPDARFSGCLGFLGNRLPDREARVEEFFFGAAIHIPDRRFVLGGAGWEDRKKPENVEHVGHVYTHEHNAWNSTLEVVLNVNRESMAKAGYSPATRVFEAAGAAACMISDAFVGIEEFLEPGREILLAGSGEEVAWLVLSLNERTRREVGESAMRRVLAEHTYAHRAEQLERILGATQRVEMAS